MAQFQGTSPCKERIRSGFASQVLRIHVLNELDRFHLVDDVIDRVAPATTTSMCGYKEGTTTTPFDMCAGRSAGGSAMGNRGRQTRLT
jgi:hypothetical protein